MDFKQLEIFVCVAKNRSFSKAAEDLFISQPSVSSQIRTLETTLGTQLLIRNTKGVSLTKDGLEFLCQAQKILSMRDQAMISVKGNDKNTYGAIDIISSTIPAQHLLPELITSFKEKWPNIVFRVEQADSHRVEQEMRSFRYDFGMAGAVPDSERLVFFPVYEDELVLVTPKSARFEGSSASQNDILSKTESAPPGDAAASCGNRTEEYAQYETVLNSAPFSEFIQKFPFIMREEGSGTRKEIEAMLSKVSVDLRDLQVPAYFSDAHSILLAVSCGMGVSLISKVAADLYVKAGLVRAIEVDSPIFRRQIYLLYNQETLLSPIQKAFADHAREYYH